MPSTVLHLIANLDRGGAQEVVRTLVRAMPATNWRPVVATFRDGPLRPEIEEAGVTVHVLEGRRHSMGSPLRALSEMGSIRTALRDVLHREQASVLQTHLLGSLDFLALATRRDGVPAVLWTVHNALLDLRADQLPAGQQRLLAAKRAGYRLAYRAAGRVADGFVAVSNDVAAAVRAAYRPPRDRLFTIPNGVDVERYRAAGDPGAVRQSLGLAADARLIIVVAKLFAQKGHAVLLDALPAAGLRAGDALLLVGEGPEAAQLKSVVRDRGFASVHFLGNRPDVPQLLAASDLFVLPSLWEGLPMALLEAMAAGLPVVATDVAGSRDVVVSGRSGILVPANDPAALASAMAGLLADDDQRARLARGARQRVEEAYSATRQAERHAEAYAAVLDRRQRS